MSVFLNGRLLHVDGAQYVPHQHPLGLPLPGRRKMPNIDGSIPGIPSKPNRPGPLVPEKHRKREDIPMKRFTAVVKVSSNGPNPKSIATTHTFEAQSAEAAFLAVVNALPDEISEGEPSND